MRPDCDAFSGSSAAYFPPRQQRLFDAARADTAATVPCPLLDIAQGHYLSRVVSAGRFRAPEADLAQPPAAV